MACSPYRRCCRSSGPAMARFGRAGHRCRCRCPRRSRTQAGQRRQQRPRHSQNAQSKRPTKTAPVHKSAAAPDLARSSQRPSRFRRPRNPAATSVMPRLATLPARAGAVTAHAPPFAMATSATTSPLDIAAVKQAIDLAHKGRTDEATNIENTIADPLARKLVEWVILRSDDTDADFSALCRVHRRQSELAERSSRCAARPKPCCGRIAPIRATVIGFLPQRAAAHRQGQVRAGARAARAGRS